MGEQPPSHEQNAGDRIVGPDPAGGVVRERMRARLVEKMFGARQSEVKLGRFVILDRLGQGGNGIVYSAYDPQLDRRVAVKLLSPAHRGDKAKTRLLREAQALARLSHPNVVPVYDVGMIDNQVFIVMEFVVGQTLHAWATAKARSWQELCAAYQQAGRGLAAAHQVGLVHRDFKPDNVLVGDDGRIRVLDFGLARGFYAAGSEPDPDRPSQPDDPPGDHSPESSDQPDATAPDHDQRLDFVSTLPRGHAEGDAARGLPRSPASPSGPLAVPLTRPGDLLGTPAYMAPEQLAGIEVGPASDQFSFCQALYESLYGHSPYAGETIAQRAYAVSCGEVQPPRKNSRVPGRLYPILCRGLAAQPDQRYPSMDALLAALGHDPVRQRMRWLFGISFAALATLAGYLLVENATTTVDPCPGGSDKMAQVWGQKQRIAVRNAVTGTGRTYAETAWPRVDGGLSTYAESWATMYRDACLAHRRGDQSGHLLDRRMSCLDDRRQALDSAVSVLAETDAESLDHAVAVVQKLPAIEYCANADALLAEVAPPQDAAVADAVAGLRARLSRVVALEDAGRYDDAIARGQAVVSEASRLDYRPFLARALLVQGRALMGMRKYQEAAEQLRRATVLGLATRANDVALEALARRIYAEGIQPQQSELALATLDIAEALIEQVADPSFVHALLLNNAGAVYMAAGNRERARTYFERALNVRNQTSNSHVELNGILLNLALVTPDPGRRSALLDLAIRDSGQQLGPAHPRTLQWRGVRGKYTLDPKQARDILTSTCALYARHHPEMSQPLGDCLYYLGVVEAEIGDTSNASTHWLQAAEIASRTTSRPDTVDWTAWFPQLTQGYGLLYSNDLRGALSNFEQVVATLRNQSSWWTKERLAQSLLGLGKTLLSLGRRQEAVAALEEAHAEFVAVAKMNERAATRRYLASTEVALATALWSEEETGVNLESAQGTHRRAIELLDRAETLYKRAPSGFERHLQEIASWRQARGLDPATR
ncbi:MAG: serine/threonine-protein kinase [Proteobacteria bacterium]|nr:serine/threonine-protein kinase [Pseudomonadota bacterium]